MLTYPWLNSWVVIVSVFIREEKTKNKKIFLVFRMEGISLVVYVFGTLIIIIIGYF